MCQPQLRAWPSPLVHLGARSPLIHFGEGHRDVLWPRLPNPESAGGAWKEDAHWRGQKSYWTAFILLIFTEICGGHDEVFSPQSWNAACRLPAGGQLSIIACRTGAALSLHRRRGWGTRYGLNPQIHSGVTALDNTTRVAVCSHLLRACCTEQIELCRMSDTGRILTHEKKWEKNGLTEQKGQKGTAADFHPNAEGF